jgi:hypothetical protein
MVLPHAFCFCPLPWPVASSPRSRALSSSASVLLGFLLVVSLWSNQHLLFPTIPFDPGVECCPVTPVQTPPNPAAPQHPPKTHHKSMIAPSQVFSCFQLIDR